jgi:hypothetical protein
MNIGEIAERFIRAAEIERAIPDHVGPAQPRSLQLPYVHDWIDKLGWGSKRLEEERKEFWERLGLMPSAHEISELEILRAWLLSVTDAAERRALLAWARAKAGGMKFKRWCFKVEHIHPETGRRRKDRALARIQAQLDGRTIQHDEMREIRVLPKEPEIGDIPDRIGPEAGERREANCWAAEDALVRTFIPDIADFSWAAKRNERRRQREARRRAKEAA